MSNIWLPAPRDRFQRRDCTLLTDCLKQGKPLLYVGNMRYLSTHHAPVPSLETLSPLTVVSIFLPPLDVKNFFDLDSRGLFCREFFFAYVEVLARGSKGGHVLRLPVYILKRATLRRPKPAGFVLYPSPGIRATPSGLSRSGA